MSNWQVTFASAAQQTMTFSVEASDGTSAFQRALAKVPFTPDRYSVVEIPPQESPNELVN